MKIEIEYHDDTSFVVEEVVKLAEHNYGKNVRVKVSPDSSAPHDLIYFALQQIITHRQLASLYDNKDLYHKDLQELRADTIQKLIEIVDSVILDNESRVA